MTSLGVISAGGRSTRYGSAKALAQVGGVRVADRVAAALRAAVGADAVRCISNDVELGAAIGLPFRRDTLSDVGAVAGVHAALQWARDEGRSGALVVGCDMPFVAPDLLLALLARSSAADVVIPASRGRRGVEPLCAWYGTACIPAIEAAAAAGDARMVGFHGQVRVDTLSLAEVGRFGDLDQLFFNVNTEEDRMAAERLAGRT
jgi:molybdopterin-guanine dinucleotide biosynthesis protein A